MTDLNRNPSAKDYYTGFLAGGEGPILGQEVKSEAEMKGVHGGEVGKNIKTVGGVNQDVHDGKEQTSTLNLHGKDYAGPQNWEPTNLGDRSPDKIGK
jgi:hypothetical protein